MSNEDKNAEDYGQGGMGEAYSKMNKDKPYVAPPKTYTAAELQREKLALLDEVLELIQMGASLEDINDFIKQRINGENHDQ